VDRARLPVAQVFDREYQLVESVNYLASNDCVVVRLLMEAYLAALLIWPHRP